MRITGKQSKTARSLLKWNPHDLASRCHVHTKRIDSFERCIFHLHQGEMDEVVRVFEEAGIEFGEDFSVTLVLDNKFKKLNERSSFASPGGVHIVVDANEMLKIQGIDLSRIKHNSVAASRPSVPETNPAKPAPGQDKV